MADAILPKPDYRHPLDGLPALDVTGGRGEWLDDESCFALWDKYAMLPNIRRHSLLVAHIATRLAERAAAQGLAVDVGAVRTSALLHDIAKTYCLHHGGGHAPLGASWVVAETRDPALARGVMLHVYWPWALPQDERVCCLPLFVLYADKRVEHDQCVTINDRFADLHVRYGKSPEAVASIMAAHEQAVLLERALAAQLKWDLYEDTFDCGRVVQRA